MKKKVILYSLLLILLLGSGTAYYVYREFNRRADDITEIESAYQKEAVALIQEFTTNEQASNALYLGKVLSVSGLIKSIENNTISLGDSTSLSSVRCSLDSLHSNEALSLKIGTHLSIKGYCSGFNADDLLGSDVILNRCAIEIINPIK